MFYFFSPQEEELNNQALPGDALILAAVISYLGPFGPEIRTELLTKWTELCQTGSIDLNPHDPRASFNPGHDAAPDCFPHGFPISLSERLHSPLCRVLGLTKPQVQDASSARLLVRLMLWGYRRTWVRQWPLLADSKYHLEAMPQFITGWSLEILTLWSDVGADSKVNKLQDGVSVLQERTSSLIWTESTECWSVAMIRSCWSSSTWLLRKVK